MTFKKTVENFVCENCGHENVGDGFTDHCQKCLWSKHVDIDPGDRLEICGGMMKPIETGDKNGSYRIKNKCQKCGFERWSKVLPLDNFEIATAIAKKRGDVLQ